MCADVPPPAPSHRRRHHRPDLHHGPSHHLVAGASSRAELWEESLRKATELAQAVANALFSLPATEGCDGPVVRLPPPTNRLPREKHALLCQHEHWGSGQALLPG
ncbi:ribosome biogenesis regulatory protein homolog isoform X5 [Triticum dicoccoides]|uniref:ribosome biogenesis regulatory protein homolog isoform X5 n=1 Tax=Triticum dicoccoides TaxID=85692 RepID=UPI001890EE21|nr:ribosome biogenesis regulatory protein homolog isoform X5 [Triticum dicoccoides]